MTGIELFGLDQVPEIAWIAGPDGRRLRFSAQWQRYTGAPADLAADEVLEYIHPGDRAATQHAWRAFVKDGRPYVLENRIRRRDGAYRWFRERALVLRNGQGRVSNYVGISSDVHDEKRSRERLEFLLAVTRLFESSPDYRTALGSFVEMTIPRFADACAIDLFAPDGSFEDVFVAGDPDRKGALLELRELYRTAPPIGNSSWGAARSGIPEVFSAIDESVVGHEVHSPRHLELRRRVSIRSGIRMPMIAEGTIVGALSWMRTSDEEPYERADLPFYTDVATRVAELVLRKRAEETLQHLYEQQNLIARTLQASFLPGSLPRTEQLSFSAIYASAESAESEIGGDWYDAFELGDGTFCFSIGDVGGHGLGAAIPMGKLRQAIRVASAIERDPARLLRIADASLRREHPDVYVTAFVAIYESQTRVLRYASAGHPPPLVRSPEGLVRRFPDPDLPLGLEGFEKLTTRTETLRAGELLVCFTDGLVEAGKDIAAGMEFVMGSLLDPAFAVASDAAQLLRALALPQAAPDDVAILSLRVAAGTTWTFDAAEAVSAQAVRRAFVERLHTMGADPRQAAAAEAVFGELVGNASRYTPGPVDIGLAREDRGAVLDVIDRGPGFSWRGRLPLDPLSESGRGLYLIATLGRSLDVRRIPGFGTHVRVRLPLG